MLQKILKFTQNKWKLKEKLVKIDNSRNIDKMDFDYNNNV